VRVAREKLATKDERWGVEHVCILFNVYEKSMYIKYVGMQLSTHVRVFVRLRLKKERIV
jgi:hypothetical protein